MIPVHATSQSLIVCYDNNGFFIFILFVVLFGLQSNIASKGKSTTLDYIVIERVSLSLPSPEHWQIRKILVLHCGVVLHVVLDISGFLMAEEPLHQLHVRHAVQGLEIVFPSFWLKQRRCPWTSTSASSPTRRLGRLEFAQTLCLVPPHSSAWTSSPGEENNGCLDTGP